MAADQVELQLRRLMATDDGVAKFPESGSDPVDDPLLLNQLFHHASGSLHPVNRLRVQGHRTAAMDDIGKILQGQSTAIQDKGRMLVHESAFLLYQRKVHEEGGIRSKPDPPLSLHFQDIPWSVCIVCDPFILCKSKE